MVVVLGFWSCDGAVVWGPLWPWYAGLFFRAEKALALGSSGYGVVTVLGVWGCNVVAVWGWW